MSKVLTAEYDAEHNKLRLDGPLEGVRDGEKVRVRVEVDVPENAPDPNPPWMKFRGVLSGKDGEEMAELINEMFPPWND